MGGREPGMQQGYIAEQAEQSASEFAAFVGVLRGA